jgi:hypothetical protein
MGKHREGEFHLQSKESQKSGKARAMKISFTALRKNQPY